MKIENIIRNQMCCGCGTCAGICPKEAIEMKINERGFYVPFIDKKKCTACDMCNKVCPQVNKISDFSKLNEFVFEKIPDKVIGNYVNCYTGYSTDENLRFEASSGGMVTQILISALEEGIINGVLVTRMKKDDPLISEPFIARTKEEILSAMGSKYCPVPANIMLKEIMKSKDGDKFAIVGLPCHIIGIRNVEMLIPKLKEKIVLHCGIFCGETRSFIGTEFLLKKNNLKKEDVISIKYRGKGWPGYLQIKTRSILNKIILSSYYYYGGLFGMFFKNNACLSCNDYSNEFADISFGDAWRIEKEYTNGTSLIVTRTKFVDEVLNKFYSEKKVFIKKLDIDQFISSHTHITFKKKLPVKISKIFQYKKSELMEVFCSFPFLNHFSTHPNKTIREILIQFLDLLILIQSKLINMVKWFIKK